MFIGQLLMEFFYAKLSLVKSELNHFGVVRVFDHIEIPRHTPQLSGLLWPYNCEYKDVAFKNGK